MSSVTPQLGVKMSADDARAYIDEVRKKMETGKQIKINDAVVTQIAQGVS